MLLKRILKIFIHCIAWLCLANIPLLIFNGRPFYQSYSTTLSSPFCWLFPLSFIFLFYFTTEYLIPKFYLTKKYLKFSVGMFLLFAGFYLLKPFTLMWYYSTPHKEILVYRPLSIDIITIITFAVVVSIAIALQIIRQWGRAELQAKQAETDKKAAELSFLKAQINPHCLFNSLNNIYLLAISHSTQTAPTIVELSFLKAQINPHILFNTLNNIYWLAISQSHQTAPSIAELSNIMRYVTDDVTKEFVPLNRELDCIRDFITLQSLRLGNNMKVSFEVTGDTGNKRIAPLILMTFVENVFKYGVTTLEPAAIIIKVFADNQKLEFFCQNRIFDNQDRQDTTGIGLANTRSRLQLVYPNKHALTINTEKGFFTVQLALQF